MKQYNFYPSLLDTFQGYLDSSEIYQQFWGFSENPSMTEREFEEKQFSELINKINRVPFDSEAANKGTAFNIASDYLILGQPSEMVSDFTVSNDILSFTYKSEKYGFKTAMFDKLKSIYNNSASQIFVIGQLETKNGAVNLYGYADYLTPHAWHDLKTTSKYKAGKFMKSWQRVVYPFCGLQMGYNITDFQFDVMMWTKDDAEYYCEYYRYIPSVDLPRLVDICERFIDFLETNRKLITDLKIFNQHLQ